MSSVDAVRLVADFTATATLSRVARGLAGGLHRRGIAVDLVQGHVRGRRALAAEIAAVRALHSPAESRVAVQLDGVGQDWPDPSRVVLQVRQAEADRVPAPWVGGWQEVQRVVTPSPSSRDALIASGVPPAGIRLMPFGVDPAVWDRPVPSELLTRLRVGKRRVGEYATRFINVGQLEQAYLEFPAGLLAAWIAATNAGDDAVLLLAWDHHLGVESAQQMIEGMVNDVCATLGKPMGEAAPIGLVPAGLMVDDAPGVIAAATHYLGVGHGTGWDLTMMEAGAAGLRLIAPDHTGYRGWLNGSIATILPARSAPVDLSTFSWHHKALYRDASWQVVDLDAAAVAIRQAVDGGDRYLPTARETILREFTWDRSAAQLVAIAEEALEATTGRNPRRPRSAPAAAKPALTLVSALAYLPVSLLSVEERLEKVRPLIDSGLSVVIYADERYMPALEAQSLPGSVRLVWFDPWSMPAARMISEHGDDLLLPVKRRQTKDTIEYLTLMNVKTDLVADAVRRGLVDAPCTGFIDANIVKMMDDHAAAFGRLVAADLTGLDRPLVPGSMQLKPGIEPELLDAVCWAASGSLLLVPSAQAEDFASRCRAMLAEVLAEGRLTWEVNIWAMLMKRDPESFHWFSSDHNDRITALPNLADPARPGGATNGLLG